jgi:hypothetical protein
MRDRVAAGQRLELGGREVFDGRGLDLPIAVNGRRSYEAVAIRCDYSAGRVRVEEFAL